MGQQAFEQPWKDGLWRTQLAEPVREPPLTDPHHSGVEPLGKKQKVLHAFCCSGSPDLYRNTTTAETRPRINVQPSSMTALVASKPWSCGGAGDRVGFSDVAKCGPQECGKRKRRRTDCSDERLVLRIHWCADGWSVCTQACHCACLHIRLRHCKDGWSVCHPHERDARSVVHLADFTMEFGERPSDVIDALMAGQRPL